MEITLHYSSTRKEVWDWYWRMWCKKLWVIHVLFFLVILFFTHNFFFAIIPTILLIFYPQIMFKPELRTLVVSEDGIDTTIGKKYGNRNWEQVASIEDTPAVIVIKMAKTGNALLVPQRAFISDEERNKFISSIRMWHSKNLNKKVS